MCQVIVILADINQGTKRDSWSSGHLVAIRIDLYSQVKEQIMVN